MGAGRTAVPHRHPAGTSAGPARAPDSVTGVLRSGGTSLAGGVRAGMERQLGHRFDHVRIHTDQAAAASARDVQAHAYTVGRHVVFGAGRYRPDTPPGRHLLAHELAHVVQQHGQHGGQQGGQPWSPAGLRISRPHGPDEHAADQAVARWSGQLPPVRGPVLQRTPATATALPATQTAGMSRATFEDVMKRRFRVSDVHTGTFEEQAAQQNTRSGVQPPGRLDRAAWQSWDPGPRSQVYDWIVAGFEDFEHRFGGWPPVTTIVFFHTAYDVDRTGVLQPNALAGASFGGGVLTIYQRATTSNKPLPFARSDPSGRYPGGPVLAVTGIPGQSPGAPLPAPTPAQSVGRIITHELGHGLAEQARQVMPDLWARYQRQVGWYRGKLYDIQIPLVEMAFTSGVAPPATDLSGDPTEITPDNWNDPRWREQPLSHYMVEGGPGEDFAEAVMAYVDNPDLLRARSPARHAFLDGNRAQWLQKLHVRPPVGDFPTPSGDIRGLA